MKLTQRIWRKAAAVTLACCGVMAWFGAESATLRQSLFLMAVYWTIFLVLFLITIAIVLLDIRYIRLQYLAGERAIYQQTLGDEALRTALRQSQKDSLDTKS